MRFALENDFIKPADDDNTDEHGNVILTQNDLYTRVYQSLAKYQQRLPLEECEWVVVNGQRQRAWYGCLWQRYVLDLSSQDELAFDLLHKRLLLARRRRQVAMVQDMEQHREEIAVLATEIAGLNRKLENFGAKADLPLPEERNEAVATVIEATAKQGSVPVEEQPPPLPMHRFRKMLLAVTIFGLVGLVATGSAAMMGLNPLDILFHQGSRAATDALPAQPQTPEERYQKSWLAYVEGDHNQAMFGVYAILADKSISQKLRGDCFYLLGTLHGKAGNYRGALGRYFEAYDIYAGIDAQANLYTVAVEIGNCHAALEDAIQAEDWLESALNHYNADQADGRKISNLGQYYLVKLDLAIQRENYRAALDFAKSRLEQAVQSGHKGKLPSALRLVGFWYAVNGCTELGLVYTDRATQAAGETGHERQVRFNFVNRVLLQRCLGFRVDPHNVSYIRDWAKMKGDSRLEQDLELALRIPIEEYRNDCEATAD